MKTIPEDDEREIRLFNELLELAPKSRRRVIEAVKAYELFLANTDSVFSVKQ